MSVFIYVVHRNFSSPDIAISGIKREVEEKGHFNVSFIMSKSEYQEG